MTAVAGERLCGSCSLRRTVDGLLADDPPGALHALRAPILGAEPMTTHRWLRRPAITSLLTALDSGGLPLTHTTLDSQPANRAVEHVRDLLVATGALDLEPNRHIDRLEHDSDQMLVALDVHDARIVRGWLHWQVLPRLRRHHEQTVDLGAAVANARRTLACVIGFLVTIEATGRTLACAHQSDIDDWFASPRARPHTVRPFAAWARRTRALPAAISLPPSFRARSDLHTDPERRWMIARRLVQDETLDPVDRVAGAMVVLYAQPLVRICALTTHDVATVGGAVTVRFGSDRLELPDPFATLIQSLPAPRRGGVAEQISVTWLFPGQRAGRHLAPASLSQRLRTIGIEPRRMRLAALDQLTAQIPPAMLAGILGLSAPHAVRHTTGAGGDWARYAADRATERPPHTVPDAPRTMAPPRTLR